MKCNECPIYDRCVDGNKDNMNFKEACCFGERMATDCKLEGPCAESEYCDMHEQAPQAVWLLEESNG